MTSKLRHPVPPETAANQSRASNPRASAWVSAHAGSGKTHVLAQRVVRLLLDGAEPSRILCLTYTKAAAANMSNRVFADLARWTAIPDEKLAAEIRALDGKTPDAERLADARRLFARALETPGGLKIQTIHAFCEAVLHQFPLEANIAGHFELLDGAMEAALVTEARRDMLTGIAGGDYPDLAEAFADVLARGGEQGLDQLLSEIVRRRDDLRPFLEQLGGDETMAPLFEEFGFDPGDSVASIAAGIWPDGDFDAGLARAIVARAQAAGKSIAGEFGTKLLAACLETDAVLRLDRLRDAFLTKKGGEFAARSTKSILSKGVAEHFPGLGDAFDRLAADVLVCSDRCATLDMLVATRAALVVADRLIQRYERLKNARGFLDFNDLIGRTTRLLARQDAGPWVQYKLDKGIDHILVDEAQDTSPGQWSVIRGLAEEFFAGRGARDNLLRTIFAVGDEKQSIYSFQGAEPAAFVDTRHGFAAKVSGAGLDFEEVKLAHSFRSTADVLDAVDHVFAIPEHGEGLTLEGDPINHRAIRLAEAGHVDLWPSIPTTAVEEPDDWTEPIDHASAPAVVLAERIAATVKRWIGTGEIIEGKGRRVTPGDVLVLVRKRDRFVHALSRALKNLHVPVAGADRLDLAAHIAVKDLIALGRFVLLPSDDLSLAALLKSPIFGLGEDDLFELAHGRGPGVTLHQRIKASDREDFRRVADMLDRWRREADAMPVFEFYAGILGRDGARRLLIQRLGHEAGEILDEFLNFCLAEERTGLPGLDAFLETLESAGPEIKREMDQRRDEVRIMTVHAAKGLEAPIVFLVDPGSAPFSPSHLPRLVAFQSASDLWTGKGFLWRASGDVANAHSRRIEAGIKARSEAEYRRLLYVGMTRAEDRLILCGYHGRRGQGAMTWHAMADRALAALSTEIDMGFAEGPVRRFSVTPPGSVPPSEKQSAATATMPAFAGFGDLPPPPRLPRPLSPSGASVLIGEDGSGGEPDRASPVFDASEDASFAIRRGIAIHRLLQMLPGVEMERREAAARRYLDRIGSEWSAAERAGAWRSVEAILSGPAFAMAFAPGSRAEVAVMGRLTLGGREHAVWAKIDRIAVDADRVLIVDYKTGRPPDGAPPDAYVAQMALYRELLKPIYPGRRIDAALLYTEAPRLIALSPDAMAASLARIAQP